MTRGIDSKQIKMWTSQIDSAFRYLEREADRYADKASDFEDALNAARLAIQKKNERIAELEAEVERLEAFVRRVPRYEMNEAVGGE